MAGLNGALRRLRSPKEGPRLEEADRRPLEAIVAQLDEYFAGERRDFEPPLELAGTPLQRQVWARLREIPYGPHARPDRHPCHRVRGADGSLTGYGGGLDRKRALLELESGVTQLPLG